MIRSAVLTLTLALALVATAARPAGAQQATGQASRARARDLGVSALIGGTPGALDAITDVPGVEVGHTTLVSGDGPLVVGKGPVRTGVTVVHPRGKASNDPVFGAWFTLNGNGEMTGTTWLAGERLPRGTRCHHQHAQRRRRPRCHPAVAGLAAGPAAVGTARGGRDLRRRPQRHQRLSRDARARLGPSTRRAAGRSPRATSAAAPA